MPFIPNTVFGIAYLLALIVAGAITLHGECTEQRRVLWVLVGNFIITRAIVSLWPSQAVLWLANDYVTSIALALYGRTQAAKACAVLFSIIAQFDLAMIMGWANFSAVAAMSDLLGYLVLIIMTGAAHDMGGHIHCGNSRFLPSFLDVVLRRKGFGRSAYVKPSMEKTDNLVKEN
jgi:hypothetical protein